MLAVTPRFLTAVRESHTVSVAARVYRPSAPTVPIEVQVVGGEVTIDRDARVRRQGTLQIAFTLQDQTTVDVVRELPFGGTCAIERGILYADGTVERVQLGRYRVDAIVWSQLQGEATLTLSDRMAQIQDEVFVTPYSPAGLHPSDAIVAVVNAVFGSSIAYHVTTTPASEPTMSDVVYPDDRASAINDMAAGIDAEAHFDNLGDFVLRPKAFSPDVAWAVDAGTDGSMLACQETLDRSSVRNGVSVRAQPATEQPPIFALATFDDPTAPTRWGGPFGRVCLISDNSSAQTQAQADATAAALLQLRLGLARTLTIEALPNPALEPDDLIDLVFDDGRTEQQRVNAVRVGLGPDAALQLITTSHTLALPSLRPARLRYHYGQAAMRELEAATLVEA